MLLQTHNFEFGEFLLDSREKVLTRNGKPLSITPKAFELLLVLVKNHGHLVEKDELMNSVWAESFVEEGNLTFTIGLLRKVLGDDTKSPLFIETIPKRGYRFIGHIVEPSNEATSEIEHTKAADSPEPIKPEERAKADVRLRSSELLVHQGPTRYVLFALGFVTAISLILLLSLNFWSGESSEKAKSRSIAVLPAKPIDTAKRDEIYEVGIADSLINWLSSVKGLAVRPLSATRKYADIEQDALSAGREQQVEYVLASNYQVVGGKIRVTAQLFCLSTGQIEETYKVEKGATDIFAMQDAIAVEVGNLLLAKFAIKPNGSAIKRGTDDEEAYRYYLKGVALADKGHWEHVRTAIEYFEQAIKLDPNYALAYARLANAQTAAALNLSRDSGEQYPKAKIALEKALAIDDNLAEAHSYLGEVKANFEGDFVGAERQHKRAIDLDPGSSVAHRMYAILLTYRGRHDDSIAESKAAIDLEPASVLNHLILGRTFLFARRYDEAITELERTAEMDPGFFYAHQSLSVAYRSKGDDERGFESFLKSRILAGEEPDEINVWKTIYAKLGWQGILWRQLEQAKAKEKKGKPNYYELASLSSELSHIDAAFAYLEKAVDQGRTITMLKVHPRFDSLRDDPRYDELLRRVGLK